MKVDLEIDSVSVPVQLTERQSQCRRRLSGPSNLLKVLQRSECENQRLPDEELAWAEELKRKQLEVVKAERLRRKLAAEARKQAALKERSRLAEEERRRVDILRQARARRQQMSTRKLSGTGSDVVIVKRKQRATLRHRTVEDHSSGLRMRPEMQYHTSTEAATTTTSQASAKRFPRPPWASNMVRALRSDLEARLQRGGLASRPLRVGTDCSGAEAPIFALRDISSAMHEELGVSLGVEHTFSCDIKLLARLFTVMNCSPTMLFPDLLARSIISPCLLARRPRLVPRHLDIYVAGFPCKDFSTLNVERPCFEGPNAQVFDGVVKHIQIHEPATFILENVKGLLMSKNGGNAPIEHVLKRLRSIPGYRVHEFLVNSKNFYLPQNRSRVYIVGVNTRRARLKIPFSEWGEILDELRSDDADVHDWLLDDDEPEIIAEYERLNEKPYENWSYPVSTSRSSSSKTGKAKKWIRKHIDFRMKLGMGNERPITGRKCGWTRFLSKRARDVLDMVGAKVAQQRHKSAERTRIVAEISRGYGYASIMSNISPCVTVTSCLWVFNRWRWAVGIEKMAFQGFPVDEINFGCLTDAEISDLAGNAMSVPVVGAFLLLILSGVDFPDSQKSVPDVANDIPYRVEQLKNNVEDLLQQNRLIAQNLADVDIP